MPRNRPTYMALILITITLGYLPSFQCSITALVSFKSKPICPRI